MTSYEGWQFDQYILNQLIGRGGFADVYRAWDDNLNRWVAIKILQKDLTDRGLQRFFEEARIMANLRHPHIITVFTFNFVRVREFNRYRKIPYLVMDYAPNGSLAQRHSHGEKLHMDTIIHYLEQIVDALEYIHACRLDNHKLVQLDIKPENLLLGANDEILISDFGIARFVQNTRQQLVFVPNEDRVGTAIYMAPERFRGQSSPATDQYALGIILYKWLTGRYPFYGTNAEIMQQQLHNSPPSLRSISPDILPAVEQVVLKALRKNPYSRFKSVRELFSALDEARNLSFPHLLIAFLRGNY
ncbi:MAG TPA: serine/threonine-protein kinase [Ktedonobacteraceae bacterium]|nr:serine/threonine-protein kinase [Ktedonobacteraceae bacterium]